MARRALFAEIEARAAEIDVGVGTWANLRMNFLADPRIEEPRFREILSRIRGD